MKIIYKTYSYTIFLTCFLAFYAQPVRAQSAVSNSTEHVQQDQPQAENESTSQAANDASTDKSKTLQGDAGAAPDNEPNAASASETGAHTLKNTVKYQTIKEEKEKELSPPLSKAQQKAKQEAALKAGDKAVEVATEGSMEACTALVFPLTMLPYVGDTVDSVAEWVCIAPAVIGGQYVEENYGQRDSFYWQAALALVAARLFGDFLLYPALATAGVLLTGYTAAAVATLSVAPYFTPVAAAGLLSMSGLAYLVYKKTKKVGEKWVYRGIYRLLTPQESDPLMRKQIRNRAIIGPPLGETGRSWTLMAAAGGAEAEWSWTWWIPFAGPINRAHDQAAAIKATLRQASHQVLEDTESIDYSAVDFTTDVLTETEGWMGAASQVLLVGGATGAIVGLGAAGLEYQRNQDLGLYAQIATISGIVGASLAGAGLLTIVVKKAAHGLIPIVVPMNYPKQDSQAKAKAKAKGQ